FRRWMPHINFLYPFYPAGRFKETLPHLVAACANITPFVVTLAEFQLFQHPSRKATLWLAPEPKEDLVRVQAALQATCPDCDDLSRFAAGFTPHLSVGQANSPEEALRLLEAWQRTWEPIRFEVSAVALLRRGPETPFKVVEWSPLAAGRA